MFDKMFLVVGLTCLLVDELTCERSCYFIVTEYTDWPAANASCSALGYHLVAIDSQKENDIIARIWDENTGMYNLVI